MKRNLSVLCIVLTMTILFSMTVMAAQKPWEMIEWDKPVSATERLSSDEYILPEGWEKALEGVEEIVHFNAGGMQHDPGTLANFELFEKLTGINVNYVEVSDNVLLQKTLSTLVSRDSSVTSMCVSQPMFSMQHLISANWVENMDAIWGADVQEMYPAGLLELFKGPEGHFYASVDTQKAMITYVRNSWLEAAGVKEMPTTWAELIEAAKKCREWAVENLDDTYYGIGFAGDHYLLNQLQGATYSAGSKIMQNGSVNLLSPEFKRGFETYVNFVRNGSAPQAVLGWTWNDYQNTFAMGKLAIIPGALNTNMVMYKDPEKAPGLHEDIHGNPVEGMGDWTALPLPRWEGMSDRYWGAGPTNISAFVINKFAPDKQKAAAMILAEVRMSKQGGVNELLLEGNSPFYPGVFEDANVIEKVDYIDVRKRVNQNAIMEVFPPAGEKLMDILMEYFAIAVTGQMTVEEALAAAQEEVDQIF